MEGRARMRLTTIPIHQTFSSLNNSAKRDLQGRKKFGRPFDLPRISHLDPFRPKASLQTFLQANPKFCKGRIRQHPMPFHLALLGQEDRARKV